MKIHTIIFDVGGTLVDAPDLFEVLSEEINNTYSINIKTELIEEFNKLYHSSIFKDIKTILNEITAKSLKKHNLQLDFEKVNPAKIYSATYINHSYLFQESKVVLENLHKKKINLIIVSDADADVLLPELKNLGIIHYFSDILISSDIKCYKTSKKVVSKIIPRLREPLTGILFVGDSKADINTARELGVKAVHIDRLHRPLPADFTITSLTEIIKIVDI